MLLVGLGVVGLLNGLAEWADVESAGQGVATITEVAYGLLGVLAAVGLLVRHRWTVSLLVAWAVAIAITAGMAPIVWGGAGFGSGLAAGAATALVAWGVVWVGQRALAA